ncbi:unnamed protein product, partial [Protopolystoma xenopodis]
MEHSIQQSQVANFQVPQGCCCLCQCFCSPQPFMQNATMAPMIHEETMQMPVKATIEESLPMNSTSCICCYCCSYQPHEVTATNGKAYEAPLPPEVLAGQPCLIYQHPSEVRINYTRIPVTNVQAPSSKPVMKLCCCCCNKHQKQQAQAQQMY